MKLIPVLLVLLCSPLGTGQVKAERVVHLLLRHAGERGSPQDRSEVKPESTRRRSRDAQSPFPLQLLRLQEYPEHGVSRGALHEVDHAAEDHG